jgi:hypothetical protein
MLAGQRGYLGPFTILEIERHIGDFNSVWVKPRETVGVRGPEGQRLLYPVGMRWPCGCDVRGPSYEMMRTSRWAPCALHRVSAENTGAPGCEVSEDLMGGYLVPREWATMRDGWHLIEATPYLL